VAARDRRSDCASAAFRSGRPGEAFALIDAHRLSETQSTQPRSTVKSSLPPPECLAPHSSCGPPVPSGATRSAARCLSRTTNQVRHVRNQARDDRPQSRRSTTSERRSRTATSERIKRLASFERHASASSSRGAASGTFSRRQLRLVLIRGEPRCVAVWGLPART
jgi:hypothetical protein